jgi:hypothetical protein
MEIHVHPTNDPKSCTEWQFIDAPSETVTHLQDRNRLHVGQAQGTPFTVSPLWDIVGFSGDGRAVAENILTRGSQDYPDMEDNVEL